MEDQFQVGNLASDIMKRAVTLRDKKPLKADQLKLLNH